MQKPLRNTFPVEDDSSSPDVRISRLADAAAWDVFVKSHAHASLYHLSGWRTVIEKTYNHRAYCLVATANNPGTDDTIGDIVGILPIVHLKNFLFGNSLISMPFFDSGGVLANNETTAQALLKEVMKLGRELNVTGIELRQTRPLKILGIADGRHKVRMVLELPGSSDILMNGFKAKLRSQIKKPVKVGLYAKIGGIELLDDFYRVFSENMRDLGSPVHSKNLIKSVFEVFPDNARITIVYKKKEPVACSVMIGFKKLLSNPWASALRKYSQLSPNMLLYWTMLEYACHTGFTHFDFGRSSPEEGTYKFKEQWGPQPQPLHWYNISLTGSAQTDSMDKSQFSTMIEYWKKLPVPVTKIVGPMIRKHIGL